MLDTLIASRPGTQRTAGGVFTSIVLHAGLIGAGVYGTLHAEQIVERPSMERVDFVQTEKKDPPPPKTTTRPAPRDVTPAPPPVKGFQLLHTVIEIPDVIPDIDLSRPITDPRDFSGRDSPNGIADGVPGSTPRVNLAETFRDSQVERQVAVMPGTVAPRYPDALRSANIEGEVLASFVVDTTGRADMSSFKVLESTHDQFTAAVRNALVNYRYYPAEIGGHKVKQLVQQPFLFNLARR
jgi:protein TonB